jgi:polysaccharide export outer membrane protein
LASEVFYAIIATGYLRDSEFFWLPGNRSGELRFPSVIDPPVVSTGVSLHKNLEVIVMSKRILLILAGLVALSACITITALSQGQSPGSAPDFQPASSGIDNQGVRRYRLGPGDILDVRVFGQPDLNSTVEIDEDGNISSLPFIEDPIPAKCRNEKEVQKTITDAYSKYLLKPRVSVRILERRSRQPAVVFGAVRSPARVPMIRRLRLHEMLATAGGVTANASGSIQVVHTEPELCPEPDEVIPTIAANMGASKPKASDVGEIETYRVSDLKSGGDQNDPFIRAGDIVIVTEGEPVFITGMVVNPRELVIKDQLTLHRAIAMAGGTLKLAKTSEVHVYRKKDGKIGSEDLKFNYDAIRKGQEPDVVLQAYDIIEVRQVGTFSSKGMAELLKGIGMGTAGSLPLRMPLPF